MNYLLRNPSAETALSRKEIGFAEDFWWSAFHGSITAPDDHEDTYKTFSTESGGWKALKACPGYYGLLIHSHHGVLYRFTEDVRAIAEEAILPLSGEVTPLAVVEPVLDLPGQEHPNSERESGSEDSALLLEERLVNSFVRLFADASDEVFEDGMESMFSQKLTGAIDSFGDPAINAIDRLLESNSANAEVAGEILRQLGSVEDRRTHHTRLKTLIRNLWAVDPRIRDAASLGIAALDDPDALGAVQMALDQEQSPHLQRNLRLVVAQLRTTRWHGS